MSSIDSAEAINQLQRIDKILENKRLLIGGLAVKQFRPTRQSKDIDLVCSDEDRIHIIDVLYPSDEWETIDENMDEYRPNYHIRHKITDLIISFGPKITEREPYKHIDWELLLKNHSTAFCYKKDCFLEKIFKPTAAALAYTKLISFINRQNNKATQDLRDFTSLTNNKLFSSDDLYILIRKVDNHDKLIEEFRQKLSSKEEFLSIAGNGNFFKLSNYFSIPTPHIILSPPLPDDPYNNKDNGCQSDLKDEWIKSQANIEAISRITFFTHERRPPNTFLSEMIRDAKKFHVMARTGGGILKKYSEEIVDAIHHGCECRFILTNPHSPAIKQFEKASSFYRPTVGLSLPFFREIQSVDKDKVEIRLLDFYPTFDFIFLERNNGKKIVVRINLLSGLSIPEEPMFMLDEGEYWYAVFRDEFDQLWKTSRVLLSEPKRIIIDGAPCSGKTTLLTGMSPKDSLKRLFKCLREEGYSIFDELIGGTIASMGDKGYDKLSENWDTFFELAVDRATHYYKNANPDLITFYDRGIHYLEIMAKKYRCTLPRKYSDFCANCNYDNPVFVLYPILDIDISTPHRTEPNVKTYTKGERIKVHNETVDLYQRLGYEVFTIPILSDNAKENVELRLMEIKKKLQL